MFSWNGGELESLPSGSNPSGASSESQPLRSRVLSFADRLGVAAGECVVKSLLEVVLFVDVWLLPDLLDTWLFMDSLDRVDIPPLETISFSSPGTGGRGADSVKLFPPDSLRNWQTLLLVMLLVGITGGEGLLSSHLEIKMKYMNNNQKKNPGNNNHQWLLLFLLVCSMLFNFLWQNYYEA